MIKARASPATSRRAAIPAELAPFVWRRHLDFRHRGAATFARWAEPCYGAMTRRSGAQRQARSWRHSRIDLRRKPSSSSSAAAIRGCAGANAPTMLALAEGGSFEVAAREDFRSAYLFLREVEHRLQMWLTSRPKSCRERAPISRISRAGRELRAPRLSRRSSRRAPRKCGDARRKKPSAGAEAATPFRRRELQPRRGLPRKGFGGRLEASRHGRRGWPPGAPGAQPQGARRPAPCSPNWSRS